MIFRSILLSVFLNSFLQALDSSEDFNLQWRINRAKYIEETTTAAVKDLFSKLENDPEVFRPEGQTVADLMKLLEVQLDYFISDSDTES